MAKSSSHFVCQSCGASYTKWAGKCEACGEWNSIVQEQAAEITPKGLGVGKGRKIQFESLVGSMEQPPRIATGIGEMDRMLGGGLVAGSAILIGGDPGIGKSTLLLQAVSALAKSGRRTAYISGEESIAQVRLRASRLGLLQPNVELAAATNVRDIISSLDGPNAPDVAVIDSIQTMFLDNIESAPGTVTQVRAASLELIKLAKRRDMVLFIVGHVTKDGQIAGPRVLEHMVDTVLYFEGERGHQFRILRAVKNRFGGTDEIGVFAMTDKGLEEVSNPSALFLSERQGQVSGAAVLAAMEGSRPLLVEIQALVAASPLATPRRAVVGWDSARLAMILAVLETRCGVVMHDKEVYLNVAGGLKVNEPAADLAVAAALLSALTNIPVPDGAVIFGEIGLSGEVRQVGRSEARLKESEKLGFKTSITPVIKSGKLAIGNEGLHHVQELLSFFRQSRPNRDRSQTRMPELAEAGDETGNGAAAARKGNV
ncbi:MAG TPA: DNA repair protein RadA [Rickettsiales bacterium]|nr:DNA repair protein RadA [Rickettsiales bacterium]